MTQQPTDEAPVPSGPRLRRAMTCCCIEDEFDLTELEKARLANLQASSKAEQPEQEIDETVRRWQTSEQGAIELAAIREYGRLSHPPRKGEWQMEEATRHVRLKRKLMGLADTPIIKATPRKFLGKPSPVLHISKGEKNGISRERVKELELKLDQWYAASKEPMSVVVAHRGEVLLAKGYGQIAGNQVTTENPMALDSAMKPLIGVQLATYVDRGILRLDEPIGNYLPDFDTPHDRNLTFRAGHVHATGIHFPWELAFSRLFYFHTWNESLIAHCKREWPPG